MSTSKSSKTKLLSPEKLMEAVGVVANETASEDIAAALVGGMAMQYYGSSRLTGDIDVAVSLVPRGFRGTRLSFGGLRTKINGVPTDLIVRSDKWLRLYENAIDTAVARRGMMIRVVLPEYLAAMKMVAARDKDMLDLEYLIVSGELNMAKVCEVLEKYLGPFAVDDFDRIVDVARWKKSKGLIE